MKTTTSIVFIYLLFLGVILASQNKTIDSLKVALKNAKQDTTRCRLLNVIIDTESDDKIWPKYNEELKNISEANLKSIRTNDELKKYYLKYLSITLYGRGLHAFQIGDVGEALKNYELCLIIKEQIRDKIGLAQLYNNMGLIFNKQGEKTTALEYYWKSLKLRIELHDKAGMAQTYNNLGVVYSRINNKEKALECFKKSLIEYENLGDKQGIAMEYDNFGSIYYRDGLLEKALGYFEMGLKINEENMEEYATTFSLINLADVYFKQRKYDIALDYAQRSLKISNKLGFPENIRNAAKRLAEICKRKGNDKNALEYYELYIQMRDSIENGETKKASIKTQFKIEFERKELEAKSKQEKKDLKNEEEKQKQSIIRNAFIGGFSLVLILAIVILRSFLQNKKKNKLIEEQKHLVEEKQKEIIDSIRYAQRIQRALLPSGTYFSKTFLRLRK